jgi:demethylmenaquinone methyltransferase/2-methoxy-6-polyprenyl-1,4-benzoquinol methylase
MVTYYRRRAVEYERIYAKPERQNDLAQLRALIGTAFEGHRVLEVSCGTAYWTEVFAPRAESVIAYDASPEVLEIARGKSWGSAKVDFLQADSYALPDLGALRSAAFAGFWWSHIPRCRVGEFLSGLHSRLERGAKIMFVDNRFVEGSSTPISRIDDAGDSFQQRRLQDGSIHEVLKNFPSKEELLATVAGVAVSAEVVLTKYFWVLSYKAG